VYFGGSSPKISYAVPPLSRIHLLPSRFGHIPMLQGKRQRSPRWKETGMDRAKRIRWQ
jgi:hypothetical protein